MIVSNTSGNEISIRWNEYLMTYMADAVIDGKVNTFPLRAGEFMYRNMVVRVDVPDCCNRTACDMKQSQIYFSDGTV